MSNHPMERWVTRRRVSLWVRIQDFWEVYRTYRLVQTRRVALLTAWEIAFNDTDF